MLVLDVRPYGLTFEAENAVILRIAHCSGTGDVEAVPLCHKHNSSTGYRRNIEVPPRTVSCAVSRVWRHLEAGNGTGAAHPHDGDEWRY